MLPEANLRAAGCNRWPPWPPQWEADSTARNKCLYGNTFVEISHTLGTTTDSFPCTVASVSHNASIKEKPSTFADVDVSNDYSLCTGNSLQLHVLDTLYRHLKHDLQDTIAATYCIVCRMLRWRRKNCLIP